MKESQGYAGTHSPPAGQRTRPMQFLRWDYLKCRVGFEGFVRLGLGLFFVFFFFPGQK